MSKKCAKCDKNVYPAEELKCLDKVSISAVDQIVCVIVIVHAA